MTGAQSAEARRAAGTAAALVPEALPQVAVTRHDVVLRRQPAERLAEAEQSRSSEKSISGRSRVLLRAPHVLHTRAASCKHSCSSRRDMLHSHGNPATGDLVFMHMSCRGK